MGFLPALVLLLGKSLRRDALLVTAALKPAGGGFFGPRGCLPNAARRTCGARSRNRVAPSPADTAPHTAAAGRAVRRPRSMPATSSAREAYETLSVTRCTPCAARTAACTADTTAGGRITLGGACSYGPALQIMERKLGKDNLISRSLTVLNNSPHDGRTRYPLELCRDIYRHLPGTSPVPTRCRWATSSAPSPRKWAGGPMTGFTAALTPA